MRNLFTDYDSQREYYEGQDNSIMPPEREERESPEIGVIRELSPKKILMDLRMNLKGFEWNPEKKLYEKIDEPLMNDEGIRRYIAVMHSVITDLVTFSNYSPEEIGGLVLYVCDNTLPSIHVNYKEYGIKTKSDLFIVDTQIFNLTLAAFKKAVGAGDRNVIGRTISESIMTRSGIPMQNMREEKKGFFNRMNPFRR